MDRVFQAFDRFTGKYDMMLVETAGGALVPLNPNFLFADLLRGFDLPVLIVAGNKLGVINHTLLTIEALQSRGLRILGIVLNRLSEDDDISTETNAEMIRESSSVDALADIPFFKESEREEQMKKACLGFADELLARIREDWADSIRRYLNS